MTRLRMGAALAAALLAAQPGAADTRIVCEIDGCKRVSIDPDIEFETLRGDEEFSYSTVRRVIDDILAVSGLAANFQILSTPEVDNAAAMIEDEVRYLAYNPSWIRQYEGRTDAQWYLYAVMAHEIGHHLQGHTILDGGSRPPTELEADEYAGFTLAGLGATEDQALALWRTFDKYGSSTHPARADRLEAVARGYARYIERRGPRPAGDVSERDTPVVVSGDLPEDAPTPSSGRTSPGDKGAGPILSGLRERPARVGEICEQVRFGPAEARACVSSARAPVDGDTFGIGHLFDGDWDTAWAEGVVGDGAGSAISMEFDAPRAVTGITLVNGFAKSRPSFQRNARAAALRVIGSNGSVWTVDLLDTSEEQAATTDLFPSVSWIEAEVTAVHPGSRYPDLAITEWRFEAAR